MVRAERVFIGNGINVALHSLKLTDKMEVTTCEVAYQYIDHSMQLLAEVHWPSRHGGGETVQGGHHVKQR